LDFAASQAASEGKHVGRLDRSIFSFYAERPAEAGAAHPPLATNPQIGLNVGGLKTAFRAHHSLRCSGLVSASKMRWLAL
jgi:hypothetical protein